ncbi:RDD family protein [Paenibacillus radicis (ex Gao et al. 2016)]|uniref:Membrane protein YteJ n=1 Tax=Paenibacillus radicis (ex Gao et al. 2016) TaxID=1737354 RepID=A0A917M6R1_9BACL|nr:RDD family protein [Paenibacillus radicis (ex Gao et al. 2016)]GGG80939.1 putative membrane protein YteJ [Paenibacillus radicis (ex Gao et al. 2016)]
MEQENEYRQYAGFWIRGTAFVIDSVIIYGVSQLITSLGKWEGQTIPWLMTAYLFVMTLLTGRTIGKWMMGIEVIGQDGRRVTFWNALLRETAGKWLSAVILCVGFILAGFDGRKRALHDHIAQTYVIRNR